MAESDKKVEDDSKQNLRGVYPWDREEQAQNAKVPTTETTPLLPEATTKNQRKQPPYIFTRKFIDDTKYNMILLSKGVLYGILVMYSSVMLRFIGSMLAPHQGKLYKRFMIND